MSSTLSILKSLPIWLHWAPEHGRKIPYYASGARRSGALDSPADRERLVTYAEALAALPPGRHLGLALGPLGDGRCVQGLDLDNLGGSVFEAVRDEWTWGEAPGYVETSPGGNGLHLLGVGPEFAALAAPDLGVEAYSGKRFFTFTGLELADAPPGDLTPHIRAQAARAGLAWSSTPQRAPAAYPVACDEPEDVDRALRWLRGAPPSVQGSGGHQNLIEVLSRLHDMGLSPDAQAAALVDSGWDDRCTPPWGAEALWRAADSLAPSRVNAIGCRSLTAVRAGAAEPEPGDPASVSAAYGAAAFPDAVPVDEPAPPFKAGPRWRLADGAPEDDDDALVEGVFAPGDVVAIGGQSGAGKTFVACHLAVALASGEPFFGWDTGPPSGVLFCEYEGSRADLHRRMSVAAGGRTNLPIVMARMTDPVSGDRSFEGFIDFVAEAAAEMQEVDGVPLRTIVIDTLGSAFMMQDENSAAETNRVMAALRRLAHMKLCAVVVVHHYGKTAANGLRGSSALHAALDAVIAVTGETDAQTGLVSDRAVAVAKSRIGLTGPLGGLDLEVVDCGVNKRGKRLTTLRVVERLRRTPAAPGPSAAGQLICDDDARAVLTKLKAAADVDDPYDRLCANPRARERWIGYRIAAALPEDARRALMLDPAALLDTGNPRAGAQRRMLASVVREWVSRGWLAPTRLQDGERKVKDCYAPVVPAAPAPAPAGVEDW